VHACAVVDGSKPCIVHPGTEGRFHLDLGFFFGGRYQFSAQTDHYGPGFRGYTQTVQVNADTIFQNMLHDCSDMYSLVSLFIIIPSLDATQSYRHKIN
jgi:hypothetical protein